MPVPCARCDASLPHWELAAGDTAVCTACSAANRVRIFAAAFADRSSARPETAIEGEAACYDHPSKKAVAACSQCGKFVCQLCSVAWAGEIWCPSCVAAGAGKAKSANLDTSRTLYDSIALILPLVSLILYPFTLVAAPASLVLAAARWGRPIGMVRRNRWRFVAAILVDLGMIVAWIFVLYFFIAGLRMYKGPQ
jgi:hypothetical protein